MKLPNTPLWRLEQLTCVTPEQTLMLLKRLQRGAERRPSAAIGSSAPMFREIGEEKSVCKNNGQPADAALRLGLSSAAINTHACPAKPSVLQYQKSESMGLKIEVKVKQSTPGLYLLESPLAGHANRRLSLCYFLTQIQRHCCRDFKDFQL